MAEVPETPPRSGHHFELAEMRVYVREIEFLITAVNEEIKYLLVNDPAPVGKRRYGAS